MERVLWTVSCRTGTRQVGWPRFQDGSHVLRGKLKSEVRAAIRGFEGPLGRTTGLRGMFADQLGYKLGCSVEQSQCRITSGLGRTKSKTGEVVARRWGWRWMDDPLRIRSWVGTHDRSLTSWRENLGQLDSDGVNRRAEGMHPDMKQTAIN